MDRPTHILAAFLISVPFLGTGAGITAILALCFGSIVPDILEPPTHRDHRQAFHSLEVLALSAIASLYMILSSWVTAFSSEVIGPISSGWVTDPMWFIGLGLLGYASHLLLDSQTPMGLPSFILGK